MNDKEVIKSTDEKPESVPYIVFEGEIAHMERIIKRLWIVILALIAVIAAGIWYESQYETISYQQDGAGLNNINTGSQGDVHGTESESAQETSGNSES